jgi:teichuronic acid biosynthesis glycosyltransferase TuaG
MTATEPLVSIVIPTYNHAHFLTEAIHSVLAQTCDNWEVIIVNNFSTDDTESIVAGFKDARIKLINFANGGAIAASRNVGIRLATAEYVAFLDSDDFWEPKKLEICLSVLHQEKLDWVCHGECWFGDGIEKKVTYGPLSRASFDALLYKGNCISTSAVVVRRSSLVALAGFNESLELVTSEDYELWLRLTQRGARLNFINDILGSYRIHAGGQSRAAIRNMLATSAVVEKFFAAQPKPTLYEKWRRRVRRGGIFYGGARALQNTHNHRAAWPWFLKALVYWPFDKRLGPAMLMNAFGLRF